MAAVRRLRPSAPAAFLGALLLAGIGVRLWLTVAYGPALAGFGDEHEYITAAAHGVFVDVQKPAGYPIFLALVHAVSDRLTFTIALQHLLGLGTGVLLFDSVRRAGLPAWLGLVPAAVALLAGIGVILEHSLLGDPLFAFLQALAVWAAVRALTDSGIGWPLLAGAAGGASFWVKTVGVCVVVVVPLALLAARRAGGRGLRPALAALLAGVALAAAYVPVQALATGWWGYERQGAWNLYGRVATFVDCARMHPPAGTRFLCPPQPPSRRFDESYYQYARAAPAVRRYGGPSRAPAAANDVLLRFSLAAITGQPLEYFGAIARGLTFYVSPRPGENYTPHAIVTALLEPRGTHSVQRALGAYYPGARGHTGGAAALLSYESATRIDGPLLVVLLVAALASPWLVRGPARGLALLLLGTALLPVLAAEAGNGYDARYGYPAFAPLAGAAAIGLWAGVLVLRDRIPARYATSRLRRSLTWGS
jgi:hypothetical protein